jgi:hypothetical protein
MPQRRARASQPHLFPDLEDHCPCILVLHQLSFFFSVSAHLFSLSSSRFWLSKNRCEGTGMWHLFAVAASGASVFTSGLNNYGQLGLGHLVTTPTPP